MRLPEEVYQIERALVEVFPGLRAAQRLGLAVWVYGTVVAQNACLSAVVSVLLCYGLLNTVRQYLREWLLDGSDRSCRCETEVDVSQAFAPLLSWILRHWEGDRLVLAVDATTRGDELVALVVSVVYRGAAIPVAWHILDGNKPGEWMGPILSLLDSLVPVMPKDIKVLVLADRGLWSPRLWQKLKSLGWGALLRVQTDSFFRPKGEKMLRARDLVSRPSEAWVGKGTLFRDKSVQQKGTVLIVWLEGEKEPWILITNLKPRATGPMWYGLRVWIELGFRDLKGFGWHWDKTKRTDLMRVSRHFLVLAVATAWVMLYGTRVEDARRLGVDPSEMKSPPPMPEPIRRQVSVFRLGLAWLRRLFIKGRLWKRLWFLPEGLPEPPNSLTIHYHSST